MEGTKYWWQSKIVWAGIISVGFAVYDTLFIWLASTFGIHLPKLPYEVIIDFLSLFGVHVIWARVTTDTTIVSKPAQ